MIAAERVDEPVEAPTRGRHLRLVAKPELAAPPAPPAPSPRNGRPRMAVPSLPAWVTFGKPSLGFYEEDGVLYGVRASRRPLGPVKSTCVEFQLPGAATGAVDGSWCEAWKDKLTPNRLKAITIALRPGAVGFACRSAEEPSAGAPPEGQAPGSLSDQMTVSVGRRKLVLRGTVRREELNPLLPVAQLEFPRPPRCEPAPWSAWRASVHHAPPKPARGIHLRFLLGDGRGLAVVSNGEVPLGWQILSWEGALEARTLFQAYRLLGIFAERRIAVGPIAHVSVQGREGVSGGWEAVEKAFGRPVERVPGPAYDGRMIALGAALAGLDTGKESLNLARELQKPPSFAALVPWSEALFLLGLTLSLVVVLGFRVQQLQGRIATQKIRSAQVLWAQGKTSPQIGSERDRLKGELPAPRDFLATNLRFSGFLAEMPAVLPRTAWLLSLETVDQLWSDKPDRHRGRRYAVLEAAAPFARPGDVDETLAALEHSALFRAQLPLAKITTFESQGQGDAGQTLFTIQCLPKGGALLEPSASSGGKETAKKETAKKK